MAMPVPQASWPVPGVEPGLTCGVKGGLTNQEVQIGECLMLAMRLGRKLALPRPYVEVTGTFADVGMANTTRFDELWDEDMFTSCANRSFGVRVVPAVDLPITLEAIFAPDQARPARPPCLVSETPPRGVVAALLNRSHIGQCAGGDCSIPCQKVKELIRNGHAQRLIPSSFPHVRAVAPFWIDPPGDRGTCCSPNALIRRKVTGVLSRMPRNFFCLHLRAEEDWWKFCCGQPLSGAPSPNRAFIGSDLLPAVCSHTSRNRGHRPSPNCYRSPAEVAATLRRYGVPRNQTIYVATGLKSTQLSALAQHFIVHTRPKSPEVHFMSYADALIDRNVCRQASKVFGMHGSSFTAALIGGRGRLVEYTSLPLPAPTLSLPAEPSSNCSYHQTSLALDEVQIRRRSKAKVGLEPSSAIRCGCTEYLSRTVEEELTCRKSGNRTGA